MSRILGISFFRLNGRLVSRSLRKHPELVDVGAVDQMEIHDRLFSFISDSESPLELRIQYFWPNEVERFYYHSGYLTVYTDVHLFETMKVRYPNIDIVNKDIDSIRQKQTDLRLKVRQIFG